MEKNIVMLEGVNKDDNKTYLWRDVKVIVNKNILIQDRLKIINNYVSTVLEKQPMWVGYITAEYGLILQLIDLCTNIEVTGENKVDLDDILMSGIWDDFIKPEIGYDSIKKEIDKIMSWIREDINSSKIITPRIDNILFRIEEFIKKLDGINPNELIALIEKLPKEYPDAQPSEKKSRGRKKSANV